MSDKPALDGQTVVVIGGSAGIGLETARLARQEGATVILTARDPDRLERAGHELGARTVAFDATDFARLGRFFAELPGPIDHVLVTGPGPYYAPLAEIDFDKARRGIDAHLLLALAVARESVGRVRPGGTLLFMGGTGGRRPNSGALISALTAALPALIRNLALELAPIRVNLIAAGFVDTRSRRRSWATSSTRAASSSEQRCRYGAHRRDLRHRRRPAARGAVSSHTFSDSSRLEGEGYAETRDQAAQGHR